MTPAEALNKILARHHPAAAACLSQTGRRLYFPKGVPAQAAEARGCTLNATIGQVTDGHGHSLALPAITASLGGLDADEATLYTPQGGRKDLRALWALHIQADAPEQPVAATVPVVSAGLTHSLCMVAELFAGPDTRVLLPEPCWGNYKSIFHTLRGATLGGWPLLRSRRGPLGWLDLDALEATLAAGSGPTVLVLNFPSNPTGYAPTRAEVQALRELLDRAAGPLVVVLDDAYHGMWWEPEVYRHSLFHELSTLDPARALVVKVDGATKELLYFGGRVAFLTFAAGPEAGEALEEKARGAARATVSTGSATAQAILLHALEDPGVDAQRTEVLNLLQHRYEVLRDSLVEAGLQAWPFNAGMFALVAVPGDPEALRRTLLTERVGVVAVPEVSALRLSFGSISAKDIPALVQAIRRHVP